MDANRFANGSKALPRQERRIIGEDIKAVQFGWPLGMPLVRKIDKDLWEVRSRLPDRIARVIFTAGAGRMVLLHGFIKTVAKDAQGRFGTGEGAP